MKFEFINAHRNTFSVVRMCKILQVSTSGYYEWLRKSEREATEREKWQQELKKGILTFFHESGGVYGSIRIHKDLEEAGFNVCLRTVGRYMKAMGLNANPKEKFVYTTDSNHSLPVYSNLLDEDLEVSAPNQVWVTDMTYVWTFQGWLYLSVVLDLFSRKVVGWAVDDHMRTELPLLALRMAFVSRQPEPGLIHHSDQGSQYCSHAYIKELNEHACQISMSRKGNPYDNAYAESFFATIKKEMIYRRKFRAKSEAIEAINAYVGMFYNTRRRHSKLGYISPYKYELLSNQTKTSLSS